MAIRVLTQWKGKAKDAELFIQKAFQFRNNFTILSASGVRRVIEMRDMDLGNGLGSGRDLSILNDKHTYAIYIRTHASFGHRSDIHYDETKPNIVDRFTVEIIDPPAGSLFQDCTEVIIFELGVTGIE